jgi:gluconate 2-dehydrogenase gamma chain
MNDRELSRRQFLAGLSAAAKGSLIVLSLPAILTACRQPDEQALAQAGISTRYNLLSDELAIELDAISARIVPSDETPGAREAGSVRFMDNVLGRWSPGSA